MDNGPSFSAEQLRYLDGIFRNRCARPGMTMETIWMEAGARKVVDHVASCIPGRGHSGDIAIDIEGEAIASTAARRRTAPARNHQDTTN